eukprot:scaffold2107_cov192-Alexandrium_tamarense.AAC.23
MLMTRRIGELDQYRSSRKFGRKGKKDRSIYSAQPNDKQTNGEEGDNIIIPFALYPRSQTIQRSKGIKSSDHCKLTVQSLRSENTFGRLWTKGEWKHSVIFPAKERKRSHEKCSKEIRIQVCWPNDLPRIHAEMWLRDSNEEEKRLKTRKGGYQLGKSL